jgi:hypothetical protein
MAGAQSKIKTILRSGLLAGTLDILAAIQILANGNATGTFRYIASGAIGPVAYEGGTGMIVLGIFIHYFIALSFAAGLFFVYPKLALLRKSVLLTGFLYGIFVWAFMQFLVLPLTHTPPGAFSLATHWKGIVILMLAVGLPIAWITHLYYRQAEDQDQA